jgi:hypothetical protein
MSIEEVPLRKPRTIFVLDYDPGWPAAFEFPLDFGGHCTQPPLSLGWLASLQTAPDLGFPEDFNQVFRHPGPDVTDALPAHQPSCSQQLPHLPMCITRVAHLGVD